MIRKVSAFNLLLLSSWKERDFISVAAHTAFFTQKVGWLGCLNNINTDRSVGSNS